MNVMFLVSLIKKAFQSVLCRFFRFMVWIYLVSLLSLTLLFCCIPALAALLLQLCDRLQIAKYQIPRDMSKDVVKVSRDHVTHQ
jgi:hypothetical protein